MIEVYHNNRCSKSRCALEYLSSQGKDFKVIEYLKEPITENEMRELLSKLGIHPSDLVRKNEALYKEKFAHQKISESEWIKILVANPKLIERPIVVKDNKAVVARPTELIENLFK